jgi:hypothetical protein
MSKTNLQAAQALLSKADSDWPTATIGLEHDSPVNFESFRKSSPQHFDATMWPSVEETREAYETVRQLREMAASLLPIEERSRPGRGCGG